MKTELKIEVPNNYSAIPLRKYLQMQRDLKVYEEDEEAKLATLFYHLCDVEPGIMSKIDTNTFTQIKNQLLSFVAQENFDLQPIVEVNGVEYGFEPNLSHIAYGAYVDISKYNDLVINENWEKIMAILYRPVSKKIGKLYDIEPYTGNEPSHHWNEVNMEVHFGALFFFYQFVKGLIEKYPEIFDAEGGDSSQHQINFSKKWGRYQSLVTLSNGELLKIDEVVKQPLEKCLLFLSYHSDYNLLQSMLHKESLKKVG